MRWPLMVLVVSIAAIVALGVRTPAVAQLDPNPTTRLVQLLAGWNLVAWTGADTPVQEALGDAASAMTASTPSPAPAKPSTPSRPAGRGS